MSHIPMNHHLRALYRFVAGLAGAYILVFGIVGLTETWGTPLFGRQSTWVLGLRTNLAFSVLSVAAGAVILGGSVIGRNVDMYINLVGGGVFLGAGLAMMTLMQTGANFLNFTIATCVVSFVIGVILLTAGLYGRVGSSTRVHAEEAFRHGGVDPMSHAWQDSQEQPHRPGDEHRFA